MKTSRRTTAPQTPNARRATARPRVKFWLDLDGECAFCPACLHILRAVESTGSIKDAAAKIGRSYRFVWGKIKQIERSLGCPLVETRVGGPQDKRSVLTAEALVIVRTFESLRQQLFEFVDGELAPQMQATLDELPVPRPSRARQTPDRNESPAHCKIK